MKWLNLFSFTADQETRYADFMRKNGLYSLRWISSVEAFSCFAFIALDYFRSTEFFYVVAIRGSMALMFLAIAVSTSKRQLSAGLILSIQFWASNAFILATFLLDFLGHMPSFYLPNSLILFLLVTNTLFGFKIYYKLAQTLLTLAFFTVYFFTFSPHQSFHSSQIFNLILSGLIIFLIGFMIERFKRFNFLKMEEVQRSEERLVVSLKEKETLIQEIHHRIKNNLQLISSIIYMKMVSLHQPEAKAFLGWHPQQNKFHSPYP